MITFKYLKIEKLKFVSCFMLGASCFAVLLFVPHAFAAQDGFIALAPIPNLTEGITANSAGLALFFNNLYKYLIGLAAILAIIQIIWSGIKIALNQDNVSSIMEWKGQIMQAIYGLVLVLSPVIVFSIINPSILDLSLNLDPLDTKSTIAPTPKTPIPSGTLPGGLKATVSTSKVSSLRFISCANDTDCKAAIQKCLATPGRPSRPQCLHSDEKTIQLPTVDGKTNNFSCPSNQSNWNLVIGCTLPTP